MKTTNEKRVALLQQELFNSVISKLNIDYFRQQAHDLQEKISKIDFWVIEEIKASCANATRDKEPLQQELEMISEAIDDFNQNKKGE